MEIKINTSDEENELQNIKNDKKHEGYQSTSQFDSSPLQRVIKKSCVKKLTEHEFNTEKLEPRIVGVYIWNSGFHGGEGVGHISVGFGEQYVSFWPNSGYKRLLMCSGQLPEVREADVFYLLKTNENDFQIYPSKTGKLEIETLSQKQCYALRHLKKLPQFPASGNEPIEITGIDNHDLINDIAEMCGCIHLLGDKKTKFDEFEGYWVKERRGDTDKKNRRLPDYVYHIRGLKIKRMQKKFEEIKSIVPQWHLLASTPLKKENSLNCIAVAIEVLRAGGLERLAGEEIIKQQFDKNDKGVFPYTPNKCDNSIKACTVVFGGCMFCAFICIFIISSIWAAVVAAMWKQYPKYFDEMVKIPALRYMNYILIGINMFIDGTGILFGIFRAFVACFNACGYCKSCKELKIFDTKYNKVVHVRGTGRTIDQGTMLLISELMSYLSQNSIEVPYDTVRGLFEHIAVPDGRIRIILEKAVENANNKYTATSNAKEQIIVDLEEVPLDDKYSYKSVFSKVEKTINNEDINSYELK